MKTIRDLADLRAWATPDPHPLETIHRHGAGPDSHLMPAALRERYGDNALNFGEDYCTAKFVEAAFNDVPKAAADLSRAQAALERVEQEAAAYTEFDPYLTAALADLRSILTPDA